MAWTPRSGRETIAGVVWLPRLLDKARRCDALGGQRLFDGYCYGDNDFIDKLVLTFLRTDDETVSALVREHASDADAAAILVERSGRSAAEIAAFNASLRSELFLQPDLDAGRLRDVQAGRAEAAAGGTFDLRPTRRDFTLDARRGDGFLRIRADFLEVCP